jgi:hypothetical protein
LARIARAVRCRRSASVAESDGNRSAGEQQSIQARNNPYVQHHHPFYTPLEKVPDSAIKAAGLKYGSGAEESFLKTFVNPPEFKKTMQV